MRSSGLVLFTCAGLLLSGGAILGGSATWMLLRISYYFWTTDLGVELGSSILFIAGAILCLPVCWLASLVPYNQRSLPLLAALMSLGIATLVLFSAGMSSVSALSRAVREPSLLNSSMHRALHLSALDPNVKSALTAMQMELKCCGVQSYNDWYLHRSTLPNACCGRPRSLKDDRCVSPMYYTGCLRPALYELRVFINSLAALGCAMILPLAVTLFASAYILVTNVLGRTVQKYQQPIQIACLDAPPLLGSTIYPNPLPVPKSTIYTNPPPVPTSAIYPNPPPVTI